MDIFNLFGSISLDTSGFITSVNNAYNNMNNLYILIQQFNTEFGVTNTNTTNTINSTTNQINGLGNSVTNTTNQINKGWTTTKQVLSNLATQGINWTINFGKSFLQTGYEFNKSVESYKAGFKTLLNLTDEETDAFFEQIRQFAIDTPLSLDGVVDTAVKLIGTGYSQDELISTMQMLGDLSMGDTTKMQGLAKALSDMRTNVTLLAQDIRQMTNRGVPVYEYLAEYLNTKYYFDEVGNLKPLEPGMGIPEGGAPFTVQDVNMLQKNSKLFYEDMLAALQMATGEGGMFYNAMFNMMDTAAGRAEKMNDNYVQTAGAFTKAIFEVFNEETITALNNLMSGFFEWASAPENQEALRTLATSFSNLATNGISVLIGALEKLVEFYDNHRPMFDAMLMMVGGFLMTNGQTGTGAALMAVGAMDMYSLIQTERDPEKYKAIHEMEAILGDKKYGIGEALTSGGTIYNKREEGFPEDEFWKFSALRSFFEAEWDAYRNHAQNPDDKNAESNWDSVAETLRLQLESFDNGYLFNVDEVLNLYWKLTDGLDQTIEDLPDSWFANPYNDAANTGDNTNTGGGIAGFFASLPTLPEQIKTAAKDGSQEGVAAGLSGVTVTGSVTTGNVMLDSGVLAGTLAPKINLILGRTMGQDNA